MPPDLSLSLHQEGDVKGRKIHYMANTIDAVKIPCTFAWFTKNIASQYD